MQFDPSHNSDIITYYYTNYTLCPKNESFLASWQFVALFTHSVLVLQVPMILFTGYCIIKKTPKAMGSLKWAMLNVHFWSSLVDIIICSLVTPYLFDSNMSGFSIGLLTPLGVPQRVQTLLSFLSVGFLFNSIAALFENRSSSFELNRFRIRRSSTRVMFFGGNFLLFSGACLPIFWNVPLNQDAAKLEILKKLVCPTEEFFTSPVHILITSPSMGFYLMTVFFSQWLWTMFSTLFFISCAVYYIYFSTKHFTSEATKKLQKTFFIGNLVQISIPLVFWIIPCVLMTLYAAFYSSNQVVNNLAVAILSLHGIVSMLATLYIHLPYRNFICKLLGTMEKVRISRSSISF